MIDLINLIYDSKFSLLLSDTSSEHIKEYLISQFSPIDITNHIDKSFIRDFKLNESINTRQYYLFDIMSMSTIDSTDISLTRSKNLQKIVRDLQSNVSENNRFIISSASYRGFDNTNSLKIIGGSTPIYTTDLIISFTKKSNIYYYSILKNRYGSTKANISLTQFNREKKIEEIIYGI